MIDVAAKVFGVIFLKTLHFERGLRTGPNQSGFRLGRGRSDQMHSLRLTLEQCWSFQQAIVMCFVDFASACDSVDRDPLRWMMAADGMPLKLLRLIKAYYSSTKMKVSASGSDSMPFEIRSGVRQGCALAPTLDSWPGTTRFPMCSGWS